MFWRIDVHRVLADCGKRRVFRVGLLLLKLLESSRRFLHLFRRRAAALASRNLIGLLEFGRSRFRLTPKVGHAQISRSLFGSRVCCAVSLLRCLIGNRIQSYITDQHFHYLLV